MPEGQHSPIARLTAEAMEHPMVRGAQIAVLAVFVGRALRLGKAIDAVELKWHDVKEDFYDRRDQKQMEAHYGEQQK